MRGPRPAHEPPGGRLPPTRRSLLGAAGALLAAPAGSNPPPPPDAGLPSLARAAAARGLRYGAHPYNFPPRRSPGLDALVARHCGLVAPVLHWPLVGPTPAAFNPAADRGTVALAASLGLPLTGAHLLWFEAVPGWFRALPGPDAARDAIEAHIRRMGNRYAAATWSVNVVNEALDPAARRSDGLREDPFLRALGPGYWDIAFRAARAAFPDAVLAYNDYGMEQDAGDMAARRRALLGRLDALLGRGTPLDAVGLQSHLTLARPFDARSYRAFLHEIARRGLKIILSELDVVDIGAPAAIEPRDRAVAAMYRRYLDAALDEPAVVAVVTWGLSDAQSWITAGQHRRFDRPDGLAQRPLPFDAEFGPKPAFEAILEAFRAAPRRPPR